MKTILYLYVLTVSLILTFPVSADTPDEVFIGLRIDQITAINQKTKNFTVVASMRIDWKVPELAFTPEPDESDSRTYRLSILLKLIEKKKIRWPALSFSNQQGKTAFES